MTASGGRRWLVGIRHSGTRAARAIRHPIWTSGTVVRGLLSTGPPATARRALNHLRRRSLPLRQSSPARRWFEHGEESLAIRWIGPVNIRHRSFEALLCHAPAGVEYRMTVPAGSRFVCECAVSPQVWQERPPRIDFTVVVQVPATAMGSEDRTDGEWRARRRSRSTPGRSGPTGAGTPCRSICRCDRRPSLDVVVTLSTRVADGAGVENAWAIFGEPRFEWRRRSAEMRRSICDLRQARSGRAACDRRSNC